MPSGGYRKPSNPAAVSGIGRNSRRTDGGPSDQRRFDIPTGDAGAWGDNADMDAIQGGAPMGAPPIPAGPRVTPLNAPTEAPDEPIGAGLNDPKVVGPADGVAAAIRAAAAAFPSPQMNALLARLEADGR